MGYIYKITNKVNGKVYIGQTCRTVEFRWKEHLRHINGEYPINKALKKYTPDAFIIETIEQCDDSHLDGREIYWIAFYRSNTTAYGYNCTAGGMGGKKIDYDEVYSLWDKGLRTGEISERLQIEQGTVVYILSTYDKYSKSESLIRGYQSVRKTKGTPVVQYDFDGRYIATFQSAKEASRCVSGSTRQAILKCCKTKNGFSGKSQWRYLSDTPPGKFSGKVNFEKQINQYDLHGNYIRTFESANEIVSLFGYEKSSILHCCGGRYKSSQGYKWAYAN